MKANQAFTLRRLPVALLTLLTVCLAAWSARAQTHWGYALAFNGANSYVSFGETPPLSGSWTAEFWINRQDSTNTAATLLDDGITSLRLEQYNGTKLVGFTKYGVADCTFNYTAPTNTWVHLAFVSDTTTTRLYVNGVAQSTNSNTISLPLRQFGAITNGSGPRCAFKGTVDEIRVWNVARSAEDIRANMAQPLTNAPAGLVAYWKFDEGSGSTVSDATINHHNGSLVNAPAWVVSTVPMPFTYTTNAGTITITGYTGPGGAVIIPSVINSLPVATIGDSAFAFCDTVTSVTIPCGVTRIGIESFLACNNLTNVTIPDSITSIGDSAFYVCTSLASVTIPASVTSIEGNTFLACTSLMSITVATNNPAYSSMDGVLFDKSQAKIIEFPCGKGGNYSLPGSVTSILAYAFYDCPKLACVIIPDSVTGIENRAFAMCTGLTNFMIPHSTISIADSAFMYCTSLMSITVATNNPAYSSVGGVLFDKSQVTILTFPSGRGGNYTIPDGITRIGNNAFFYCTGLINVIIPTSVTRIGDGAFYYCDDLTSLTIPKKVTSIGPSAFNGCSKLVNITIPNSVTSLGDYAFASCDSLTGIYFGGNAPSLGASVFSNLSMPVYYLLGTTGWAAFDASSHLSPAVLWNARVQTGDGNFGVRTNQFGFTIAGTTDIPIVVEACTNLACPTWTLLQTCCVTNGSIYFCDPQRTNYPGRFYRVRWP